MDILVDKSKSDSNQPRPFWVVLQTIRGFIGRLTGLFALTEEERLEAGIFLANKRRDK